MPASKLSELEKEIGYSFKDRSILDEALRHSSYVNEQQGKNLPDNERLEFLGDAVINLVAGHLLVSHYPDFSEGHLSRMRAHLVNESQLSELARKIKLGNHIRLGKGETLALGNNKPSILADAFEALMAAIYLDGGYACAFEIISSSMLPIIMNDVRTADSLHDYKSRFQELIQSTQCPVPQYDVVGETGPDHDKTFVVKLVCKNLEAYGYGKSKKIAEQDAARKAYELFMRNESA